MSLHYSNQAEGGSDFGRGLIVRDHNKGCDASPNTLGNIVFDDCFFHQNHCELIYLEGSILTLKDSIFYNNEAMEGEKGGIVFSGISVNEFDHVLSNNVFKDNDGTDGGIHSRWISRGMPSRCKDLPSAWSEDPFCKSLQANDGNCATGNLNPQTVQVTSTDCLDGIWLKWPMNKCVELESCQAGTPSASDIYPMPVTDLSAYIVERSPTSCSSATTTKTASTFGDPRKIHVVFCGSRL